MEGFGYGAEAFGAPGFGLGGAGLGNEDGDGEGRVDSLLLDEARCGFEVGGRGENLGFDEFGIGLEGCD